MLRASLTIFLVLLVMPGAAQVWGDTSLPVLGARAAALGGAFTAVADDATAFHWNPAGLAQGPFLRLGFSASGGFEDRDELVNALRAGRADAPGSLSSDRAIGFSGSLTLFGFSIYQFRYTAETLSAGRLGSQALETLEIGASFVQSLPVDDLTVGVNLRYVRGNAFAGARAAQEIPAPERNVSDLVRAATATNGHTEAEPAFDLGILYQPREFIRFGFAARNLNRPTFHSDHGESLYLDRQARVGVAFFAPGPLVVSADVDLSARQTELPGGGWREVSVGAEKTWSALPRLSLRGGLRAEFGAGGLERPALSAGIGVRLADFELSVAGSAAGARERVGFWAGLTYRP